MQFKKQTMTVLSHHLHILEFSQVWLQSWSPWNPCAVLGLLLISGIMDYISLNWNQLIMKPVHAIQDTNYDNAVSLFAYFRLFTGLVAVLVALEAICRIWVALDLGKN